MCIWIQSQYRQCIIFT